MDKDLSQKIEKIESILGNEKKIAVAYSGGVDSTFLLFIAEKTLGAENVMAITGNSFTIPGREIEFCKKKTAEFGIKHIIVKTKEYLDESYLKNDYLRCYFCKIALFKTIRPYISDGYKLSVGTNAEDEANFKDRPGMKAEKEFNVLSPLKEAGFFKNDIRNASKFFGLDTWDKPQMACLASRIPFGNIVTEEKIKMVERAEDLLKQNGFGEVRVRHYGKLAKIEVPAEQINNLMQYKSLSDIILKIKEIGFKTVAVDIEGMNHSGLNL
ncbi:MAG: ATP-dependent sacrificial sulfur transferase LarE [Candidatus Acididesulfobacter diazotrophicus]|jgi:uncharacterized protein|uniref:ATP-dependent sacrificial sulfur transferase LarE n=1 Tax=Candidatus Acididesulfobacter diazotrophicus TaxID=2597226 RepID=A0A519BLD8_9DELT|nr:MAG: ATP-dependent sacrificial sulfur transferase LarE [Candidatus Acididesulfobacter diazotrophicus]